MNLINWIYPKKCVSCGVGGSYICPKCQSGLIAPMAICPMCCQPSPGGWTHKRCKNNLGMERLMVGLPYKGIVQKALKRVKYRRTWDILGDLGRILERKINLNPGGLRDFVIVAVPMHKSKERERGFNQAEMLAKLVAEIGKVPNFALLARVRETKPMYGLKKKERADNVEGAFGISRQHVANDEQQKKIILVDDVFTTGATMRECAKVLKKAGVREVWGITLAR